MIITIHPSSYPYQSCILRYHLLHSMLLISSLILAISITPLENRITNCIDEFAVSNCTLIYFDVPYYYSLPLCAAISWSKYKYNISIFTQLIYSFGLAYNCLHVPYVLCTLFRLFCMDFMI